MYSDNPIGDLADCIAHAAYVGFSDIQYEDRDWQHYRATNEHRAVAKVRRPGPADFEVYAMFSQLWGSTALGYGGIGGAAMTNAYTIVLYCANTGEYLVYFGGRFCYRVQNPTPKFFQDCADRCLLEEWQSTVYHERNKSASC